MNNTSTAIYILNGFVIKLKNFFAETKFESIAQISQFSGKLWRTTVENGNLSFLLVL